jgi:membrane protease YdiL (CAAX protease family)
MRTLEFATLFLIVPAVFAFTRHRIPPIPALWVLMAYCLVILLRDPAFDRQQLWNSGALARYFPAILLVFSVVAAIIAILVHRFAPALFLSLPRNNPLFWAVIMILYPVFSVYPQGIIYRAFLFHRYRGVIHSDIALVIASAVAFAYVHIIFKSPLAVGLTFVGGLLFAARYLWTGSLFVSSFEHALYGCLMFTIGLGRSFYHGAVR